MRPMIASLLLAAVLAAGAGGSASAASTDPDWPCIQRKMPEISIGQVWAGPPLDGVGEGWRDDAVLAELARLIASRRTEMAEAKEKIAGFAASAGAERNGRLTSLFAGVFATINSERGAIIAGIGRYARRQHALADKIASQSAALDQLPVNGGTEDEISRREELAEAQAWDTRIFRDRERSLKYVCEMPVLLEQRAFALGKEIAAQLQK